MFTRLLIIIWEITSRLLPYIYSENNHHTPYMFGILNGIKEIRNVIKPERNIHLERSRFSNTI